MKKFVCKKTCQIRIKGKIRTVRPGEVVTLKKGNSFFREIKSENLDFETASEEELFAADFDVVDLRQFIKERYDQNPRNRNKENSIKMLLDCRFRDLSESDVTRAEDGYKEHLLDE